MPDKPIRVLVISNYRSYHTVRPEASIFIGLAKLGFEIHIMTWADAIYINEFETAGIKVIPFHPAKKFNRSGIRKIREYIIKEGIDIVHLFNSKSTVAGIRAAKNLPVKVVLYRGYTGHIHWYDPAAYLKYLNPRVDKIVCNSKGVEEDIQRQLFFDRTKTITINKGHRIEWYKDYQPLDIKKELNIPENAFLLVHVSNNRKMKGIPYLLKAMNDLPDVPIHLILAGRDLDTKKNKALISDHKKSHIHFLGFRKDVLNIVAACDVFVLPSIYGESITKSVIEAMSLGITPLISDIPGNRELVVNGESGIVFPSKNEKRITAEILHLYENREFCRQLGKNAKQRISDHLNTDKTILKYKELYEGLVKEK